MHWVYFTFPSLIIDMHPSVTIRQGTSIVYRQNSNCITQVSHQASHTGIQRGMGLAQALSIDEHVTVITDNRELHLQYLKRIATSLYQIASDIIIDKDQGIAVRLDNLTTYYGTKKAIWLAIKAQLHTLQVNYQLADGWNIPIAKVLCLHGENTLFLNADKMHYALSKCSLISTDLTLQDRQVLERIGVKTIGQLLNLPMHELGRRFKNDTLRYIQSLTAKQVSGYSTFIPETRFYQFIEPEHELENTQQCRVYLHALLDEFGSFLRYRNLVSNQISIGFSYKDSQPSSDTLSSATPAYSPKHWKSLLDLWLQNRSFEAPVISMSLSCDTFEALQPDNHDFFVDKHSEFSAHQLLGRLRAKLGNNAIRPIGVSDDHRFDKQIMDESFDKHASLSFDFHCAMIYPHPRPLSSYGKVTFGPVRIETGWWQEEVQKRDYFIIRSEIGQYLLAFKDVRQDWFVQGCFA